MSVRLSIITVCFNNKEGLQRTIESVREQTFKDFEFVVIDGGSKDGSKDVIEANKDMFAFWCSERDGGIYQGMNKGIDHASGEYCIFLNSGDYLAHKDVLKQVFGNSENPGSDILYGNVVRVRGRKKTLLKYPKELSFYDFYQGQRAAIHHQGSFIKRDLFEKYGKFREDTYMNADWSFFFLTVVKCNCTTKYVNCTISVCDATGQSQSYSANNPKVQSDFARRKSELEEAIPSIVLNDCQRIEKRKCKLSGLVNRIKWHLSVLVPLNCFVALNK